MAYTIMVDEAQHARIVKALELLDAQDPPVDDGTLEGFGVSVLTVMFKDIPNQETGKEYNTPHGLIHGLCL